MKEKAKLYKVSKDHVTHLLSKRLNGEEQKNDLGMMEANVGEKRKNLGGGGDSSRLFLFRTSRSTPAVRSE